MWTFRNFRFCRYFDFLVRRSENFNSWSNIHLEQWKVRRLCSLTDWFPGFRKYSDPITPSPGFEHDSSWNKMNTKELKSIDQFLPCSAKNHHGRSQLDCFMIISVFDQIANMAPASIFVFGNRSWAVGTSSCKAAYYVNTFISFGRCIQIYSEKYLLLTEFGGPWNPKVIDQKVIDSPPPPSPYIIHTEG